MIRRRDFLRGVSGVGTGALLGLRAHRVSAEPPPETTRLRLGKTPALCTAPQFVAEQLFHAEGFVDTQYLTRPGPVSWAQTALAAGEIDIQVNYATNVIRQIDAGDPVVLSRGPRCLL